MISLIILLVCLVALGLGSVVAFQDKQLISKKELKELRAENSVMDDALRQAFVNPEQSQLYISNAFYKIQEIKSSTTKELN